MIRPPGLRKGLLATHIAVSVGWVGAVCAYVALDIETLTSRDVGRLRVAYGAMELISRRVIVPLALASLLTGLVVSLGSKWGLFRHYWVLISLLLTTIATLVLLTETQTIRSLADTATDPAATGEALRALGSTLVHSVGGTLVLLVVLLLNVFKPQGMTRYGWRKQQELSRQRRRMGAVSRR